METWSNKAGIKGFNRFGQEAGVSARRGKEKGKRDEEPSSLSKAKIIGMEYLSW